MKKLLFFTVLGCITSWSQSFAFATPGFHSPRIIEFEISSEPLDGIVTLNWVAEGNPASVSVWNNAGELLGTRNIAQGQPRDILNQGTFIVYYRYFPVTFRIYVFNEFGDDSGSVLLP